MIQHLNDTALMLYSTAQSLRIVCILFHPLMKKKAKKQNEEIQL